MFRAEKNPDVVIIIIIIHLFNNHCVVFERIIQALYSIDPSSKFIGLHSHSLECKTEEK